MARAAVTLAAEVDAQTPISLHDVVWLEPLVVEEQPLRVSINLWLNEESAISYEITSQPEAGNARAVVHCQGRAMLGQDSKRPQVDLTAIQAQSHHQISVSDCYETYQVMGIEYGSTFQTLEQLYVGEEQLLARLCLPSALLATLDLRGSGSEGDRQGSSSLRRSLAGYVLHPSMLDGALQASVALLMGIGATSTSGAVGAIPSGRPQPTQKPLLPFALETVDILAPCQSTMWALLRLREGESRKSQKIDIDVCDEYGQVCVRLIGFSSRALEGTPSTKPTPSSLAENDHAEEIHMLMPVWETIAVTPVQSPFLPMTPIAIVGGTDEEQEALQFHTPNSQIINIHATDPITTIVDKLAGHGPLEHLVWIAPSPPLASCNNEAIIVAQNQGVLFCFRTIKALLQLGYGNRKLSWSVITRQTQPIHARDVVNPAHASIHGLIGSLAKEYPNWSMRLIDLEAHGTWPLPELFTLPPDPQGNAYVYRAQEWYQQQFLPVQSLSVEPSGYRSGGIYVVIGGAGGIGEVWSEYVIRRYQAQIIWIGRRKIDAEILAKQERLTALGPRPHYITADASERSALQQAYEEIKRSFGHVHGVVHSAIVLLDQSLANINEERFQAALAAKVDVSVHLAHVFSHEPLDFVLFFSSLNAFTKMPGQSNYAAGCTFEDAFARSWGLAQGGQCAVKIMNWGYWGSVGVVASPGYRERMARAGFGSIEPAEAMEALEVLLASPIDQCVFVKTTKAQALLSVPSSGSRKDIDSRHLPAGKGYPPNPNNTNLHSEEPFSRRGVPLWSPVVPIGGRPQGYAPTQDHPTNIALPNATWYKSSGNALEDMHLYTPRKCSPSIPKIKSPSSTLFHAVWQIRKRMLKVFRPKLSTSCKKWIQCLSACSGRNCKRVVGLSNHRQRLQTCKHKSVCQHATTAG